MTRIPAHKIKENSKRKIPVLAKRRDFLRVAAARKKWVAGSMIVQVAQSRDKPGISVGYTASKKVGNAIKRNRAKRRLREVVRHVMGDRGADGHDYVLIARTATVDMPYDQLIRDFRWCLRRLHGTGAENKNPGKSHGQPDQSTNREQKR